ncbi:MAG: peptide chain release factor 2 [Chloroflexi bacterium]|nr:peptide chain release factor 2 [Chloroflexota bacterium]
MRASWASYDTRSKRSQNAYPTSWCVFDVPALEQAARKLEEQSVQPGFWDDAQAAQATMKRLADLNDTVETWRGLERRSNEASELAALAAAEGDESLIADLERDVAALVSELDGLELGLSFSGPYDARDAILAIHAGAGGTESQDWAEMLLRMYLRWAERRGYETQVLDMTSGEEAGLKSVTVEVRGKLAYGYMKSERGVHRLVRLSPFDSDHARHTSFALVEVMPEAESAAEVTLDPDDLRIDTFRASGHGGQNVQKNSTAIRITHIPTGIAVVCQNERSQSRNKESALRVLEARLLEVEVKRQADERAKIKGEHVDAGWGNQIRSYVLHPYKLVKDHRTDFEVSSAEAVLDGDLDPFIDAYLKSTMGSGGS